MPVLLQEPAVSGVILSTLLQKSGNPVSYLEPTNATIKTAATLVAPRQRQPTALQGTVNNLTPNLAL